MRFVGWILGFAIGYGIGWVAGRLYAPQAGADTIHQLDEHFRHISEEADHAAEATRQELEARYRAAKSPGLAGTQP